MKRVLLALAVGSMLMVGLPNAAQAAPAEWGRNCNTYHNPAGGKTFHLCASVMESDTNSTWWGRAEGWVDNNEDAPYGVQVVYVRLWSTNNPNDPNPNWCNGNDNSGCDGDGRYGGSSLILNWDSTPPPIDWNTDHYATNEHHCTLHSEVYLWINWTSTYAEDRGFNSGNKNSAPECD